MPSASFADIFPVYLAYKIPEINFDVPDTPPAVLDILLSLSDEFEKKWTSGAEDIQRITDSPLTKESIRRICRQVSEEMFAHGCTWIKVVAYFVFIQKFIKRLLVMNTHPELIGYAWGWAENYGANKVQAWLDMQPNGWDDLVVFHRNRNRLYFTSYLILFMHIFMHFMHALFIL